jgi:hypothetical protein
MVDSNLYKIFSKSFKTEYYTDKIWSKRVYGSDEVLFRPDKTFKRIQSLGLLKFVFQVVKPFWFFILFSVNIVKFFRCVRGWSGKKRHILNFNNATVCLNLTAKATALFKKNCKSENRVVFQFPWSVVDSELEVPSFNSVDLLSIRFLLRILFESLFLTYLFIHKNKKLDRFLFLQTYDSYNWLLAYYILDELSLELGVKIYTSNQLDRWAVLSMYFSKKITTSLIMHGVLGSFDFERKYNFSMIARNFKSIYYYPSNLTFLKKNLENINLQYIKIKSNIELQEVSHTKYSILWVGGPAAYHDSELKSFALLNFDGFRIYYKPHPMSQNLKLKDTENIVFIKDQKFYPRVAVVVSHYYSTLLDEYEAENIPNFIIDNQERLYLFKNFLSRIDSVCVE